MLADPKKSRILVDHVLLEQFRRKGYKCREVEEHGATVFIITHEKKNADTITQLMSDTYKRSIKTN